MSDERSTAAIKEAVEAAALPREKVELILADLRRAQGSRCRIDNDSDFVTDLRAAILVVLGPELVELNARFGLAKLLVAQTLRTLEGPK